MKLSSFVDERFMDKEPKLNDSFEVSALTRRNLLDELVHADEHSGVPLWGRLDLIAFLKRIWPLEQMPSTDDRFESASGDIWQHMVNNNDWDYHYLFNYLDLANGSDAQFLRFVEELVHPVVRPPDQQTKLVELVNRHIERDGIKLHAVEQISGYPIYKAIRQGDLKVWGNVKNLIFAADGPKPEIVLDDSLNNDIRIVKNEDHCLVFDLPIPSNGLKWIHLVNWWAAKSGKNLVTIETDRSLYRRLLQSLSSEPEKLFFNRYYEQLQNSDLRSTLPALIPQVYLHYDPYTFRALKGDRRLPRQRMDFLLLFSNFERVVIEIDGKQHYSHDDKPSPEVYARMVAADRKLRLAGYEIYRFGGYELQSEAGKLVVDDFISDLFRKHQIAVHKTGLRA